MDPGSHGQPMRRLDPAMECWRQPIKGDCCLLCSQTPPTVVVWGILERRGAQGLPSCPSSDISTPLGLSRQHLSYLQEIGSGWFGKVRGLGGRQRGIHTSGLCSCSMSTRIAICSRPPSPAPTPLSLPPSLHLSPTPTHLPPHLSVSASLLTPLTTPPRHPALHASVSLSILPSVPACIGLWACESLTPCLVGDQGGGT